MKKTSIFLFIFASTALSTSLAACSVQQLQVTVTSAPTECCAKVTVTSTPHPTETPFPTPTLHPQFIAAQEKVAASGERFILLPDGTIQDGAIVVPGLLVDKNGIITLQGDSSQVTISPEDVSFDDDKGVNVAGYTLDQETGKWGVERPIKEFPWCKDMHLFEQCVIDVADLQEHGRFTQSTLTEGLFDPTQLKIMTEFNSISSPNGKLLVPNIETAPNYKNEATAPFKKNYIFGMTTINGVDHYVIQVPYYIEGVEVNDFPVITGVRQVGNGAYREYNVGVFLDRMNVVPWNISDLSLATEYINPKTGVNFTLEEVQNIVEEMKVGNFANTNGLVLKFEMGVNSGGWFE